MRCRQTARDFSCVTHPYRRNFFNYVDLNSGWMTTFITVERLNRYYKEVMKSGGAQKKYPLEMLWIEWQRSYMSQKWI